MTAVAGATRDGGRRRRGGVLEVRSRPVRSGVPYQPMPVHLAVQRPPTEVQARGCGTDVPVERLERAAQRVAFSAAQYVLDGCSDRLAGLHHRLLGARGAGEPAVVEIGERQVISAA